MLPVNSCCLCIFICLVSILVLAISEALWMSKAKSMPPIFAFLPLLLPIGVIVIYVIALKLFLMPRNSRERFIEFLESEDLEETDHITVTPYFNVVIVQPDPEQTPELIFA